MTSSSDIYFSSTRFIWLPSRAQPFPCTTWIFLELPTSPDCLHSQLWLEQPSPPLPFSSDRYAWGTRFVSFHILTVPHTLTCWGFFLDKSFSIILDILITTCKGIKIHKKNTADFGHEAVFLSQLSYIFWFNNYNPFLLHQCSEPYCFLPLKPQKVFTQPSAPQAKHSCDTLIMGVSAKIIDCFLLVFFSQRSLNQEDSETLSVGWKEWGKERDLSCL